VTLRDAAPTSRAMVVAVMVSMVAFLDSTVINLALPATEHDLGGASRCSSGSSTAGLISVGTASATGFARVLEVSAALFALGALCAALSITNLPAGCQPVPCDIAALCRDRPDVQPALASSPSAATEPSPPQ
jgi:hypothetical protein